MNMKILNQLFIILLLLGTLLVAVFAYLPSHLLTYFAVIPLVIIPDMLDKMKLNLEEKDKTIYFAFVFFAYFLGSVVNLYNITWWYDILMHFISGIVAGYLGYFILRKLKMYQGKYNIFNFIFILSFSIAVAGIWEIAEFSMDRFTGSNLQHWLDTGVIDTMEDIICGTLGGLVFALFKAKRKK